MATAKRLPVGIEIGATEIRAVRVRAEGSGFKVTAGAFAPTPPGTLVEGVIADPAAAADAISGLLSRLGESGKDAVIGVPSESVVARVIEVPPVPDEELGGIVNGEVRHFNILREDAGAYDYLKLHVPEGRIGAPQVLVMAADEPVLASIRETARMAGLRTAVAEPLHMGLLRTALLGAEAPVTGLFVLMTDIHTDIAVVEDGGVVMYRTIDHGTRALLSGEVSGDAPFAPAIASAIGTEIRRSIEYYRREYPTGHSIRKAYFATNTPEAHGFGEWLQDQLDLETSTVGPPSSPTSKGAADLALPMGHRYSASAGLALQDAASSSLKVFELSPRDHVSADERAAKRGLEVALIASIAFLAVGIGVGWFLGGKAARVAESVVQMKTELRRLQNVDQPQAEARMAQMDELRTLAAQGVPFPQLMDVVASSLDSGVGLASAEVDAGWRLKLAGEAVNEMAMITTLDRLRQYPGFTGTSVESFASMTETATQGAIRFEMSAQYLGWVPTATEATGGTR